MTSFLLVKETKMEDNLVEKIIQDKGLTTAPRLTPDQIKAKVKEATYTVIGGRLTVCVLELQNGFFVIGESAASSLENFDKELGEQIAYKNALDKVWMLEGYLLREKYHGGAITINLEQCTSVEAKEIIESMKKQHAKLIQLNSLSKTGAVA